MSEARNLARKAKETSAVLSVASDAVRSAAIRAAADAIEASADDILSANAADLERARSNNMPAPLQDRLLLDGERLCSIAQAMREIAIQEDPLGRVVAGRTLASGVRLAQVTVPLGVVAIIYEARPNVTADSFALCIRAGNALVLRGGSAAHNSCAAIVRACRKGLATSGLPEDACCYLESSDRAETEELMRANGLIDVLIPRGGASLIRSCVEHATVPVIETGTGNCHVYLHETADVDMAVAIVMNGKTQRPGVCNAVESLLVDRSAATRLLPAVLIALRDAGVELVGDETACAVGQEAGVTVAEATESDWGSEYLDLKISIACVDSIEEAVSHINTYGTHHSDAIVTADYAAAETFVNGVDSAAVYVNASTRFTDGGVFGLGGEIGISTQKLHVRGPFAAAALTTTKYIVRGDGQVR